MDNNPDAVGLQIEVLQIGSYCKIIKDLLIKFRSMSIIKILVFSFILKKKEILNLECYNAKNTTDLVIKALAEISGRRDELYSQFPYMFMALFYQRYRRRSLCVPFSSAVG